MTSAIVFALLSLRIDLLACFALMEYQGLLTLT